MKRPRYLILVIFALVSSFSAQKIERPTLTPAPLTEQQRAVIQEGISLHDRKDYDGAIAKYKQVLAENPNSTLALYELALSYYTKGDKTNAIETAVKGSKYRADELPLFYGIIANVIDDVGKPDEAVKIYLDAIALIKDDKESARHLASLYYNLGVTYARQKKYHEARAELKKAVEYNYSYASPHYLLSEVFNGSRYKVPSMLAAARFVTLEYNTPRTARSSSVFVAGLEGARKDEKTGSINIFLDMDAPKDEGDFAMYDLILATLTTVKDEKDRNKSKGEIFADAVDSLIAMLSEDKKLKSTFVGKHYVTFLSDLKKNGHSRALAYLLLRQAGNNAEAEKWTDANMEKVIAMLEWARSYQLPQK